MTSVSAIKDTSIEDQLAAACAEIGCLRAKVRTVEAEKAKLLVALRDARRDPTTTVPTRRKLAANDDNDVVSGDHFVFNKPPPSPPPKITRAPQIGEVYWCHFPEDNTPPEMWKVRPIIVVASENNLYGVCVVIPLSTVAQDASRWSVRLSNQLENQGGTSWAVCSQPYTVGVWRLSHFGEKTCRVIVIPQNDLDQIAGKLKQLMSMQPIPPKPSKPVVGGRDGFDSFGM